MTSQSCRRESQTSLHLDSRRVEMPGRLLGYPQAAFVQSVARMPVGRSSRRGSDSALKHRPADVVPQPLVIQYELANRLRQLITLPLTLESPRCLALACRCSSTGGLDRIGGRAQLVRGDMGDGRGLASGVRGVPCNPTQVSGRTHRVAPGCTRFHHLDLATHPGTGMLDRMTRSWVPGSNRLEAAEDVLRAGGGPESEELVIRVLESPTTADRYEARIPDSREDHGWHSFRVCP